MPSKAHVMKMCKDGMSEAEMLKMHPDADKDKLKQLIKDCKKEMNEALEGYIKLIEGEEDKATLVMAAKDMVDRLTGWMEDTAEMQTESMLELGDKIRDELGSEKSEEFINTVKPALENWSLISSCIKTLFVVHLVKSDNSLFVNCIFFVLFESTLKSLAKSKLSIASTLI